MNIIFFLLFSLTHDMYFKALSYLARTLIYLLTSCMCIEYNKALDTVAVILNFQSRTLSVAVFVHFKLFVFWV